MPNRLLIIAAALDAAAALLHIGCIAFGASWYRAFGAGEGMARLAEAGSWRPAVITAGIATVLATWSLYAMSGAGVLPKLPLLQIVLCLIAGVYLLRGVAGIPIAFVNGSAFWWWSSAICLGIGLVHAFGIRQVWPRL